MANDDTQTIKEYIEQKGGTNVYIDRLRRGHPRIYFTYRGIDRYLVVGRSPSDYRALENSKSAVNELLTDITDVTPNYTEEVKEEIKHPSLELPQTFGERLKYAREQQQLSRERLANVSGVEEDLIKHFELTKQESLQDFTTALLLSSALNLSLAYLVGEQTAKEFEPMTELGEAISKARQQQGMSLTDVAIKAGMSVQQLANVETGLFTPPPSKIDQIAVAALDIKRETLTKEEPVVATPTQPTTSPDQRLYDSVNTLKDFAQFFKFLRQRKGLSQVQTADAIGMHYPSEVSKVERSMWAGGVYNRHEPLARVLGVPPNDMKIIIDRVIKNAGPSPSRNKNYIPAPRVNPPEPEVVHNVTRDQPGPTQVASPATDLHTTQIPGRLELVIREQAEITRALMRSQHQELISILRTLPTDNNPAEMLHRVIGNLFRKD